MVTCIDQVDTWEEGVNFSCTTLSISGEQLKIVTKIQRGIGRLNLALT